MAIKRKLQLNQRTIMLFLSFLMMFSVTGLASAQSDGQAFIIGEISNVPVSTTNTTNGVVYNRRTTTHDALAELGYVEGDNVTYIFNPDFLFGPDLLTAAQELLDSNPNLIIAYGAAAAHAVQVQQQTNGDTSVPVVFVGGTDPVEEGLVTSLQNLEGNITGIGASSEVYGKQLEWLMLIVPSIERIYMPHGAAETLSGVDIAAMRAIEAYAESINVEVVSEELATPEAITEAAANLGDADIDAIMLIPRMGASPDFVAASMELDIPLTAAFPNNMDAGPFLSYNYTEEAAGTEAARFIDRILRGAAPNSLPVELIPYSLVINLKTAEEIGVSLPDDILLQADIIVR